MQNRLPQPNKDVHLSKFGYSLSQNEKERRTSLKRASKRLGTLSVMRRVNLIRNLSRHDSKQKQKLSKDVEFMKSQYKKTKKE
ncbi:n-acetyltransferase [Bodo saltans virus]|jgi:hypothetical protein|uniref:N-acetyltransferase n=1 Tax=Bodo saltans virus TaxID=2024608 RepID=A0A2H4UVT3_9VIRU|nr:n-acetyltransferase [Bodo saltans virus]ATZ81033.1 n-acetyltransferase [Bodo saltans virus]